MKAICHYKGCNKSLSDSRNKRFCSNECRHKAHRIIDDDNIIKLVKHSWWLNIESMLKNNPGGLGSINDPGDVVDNVAEAQPLSGPLQSGIRFLRFPLPALPTAFLTVGLPLRGSYTGLPCSAQFARDGLGSAYPPVALVSVPPQLEKEGPARFPFWVRPVSVFGLLRIDDVYQQFTCVNHTVQPCAPSASTLADMLPPRRFHTVQRTWLRCPEGFTPNRYQFRMLQ